MPSTIGHGLKRAVLWAILYARVSTDEQARSGYSLAQQIEALRAYAAREGYEILEEVVDPGQSGASLERPGMDRVRDLVAAGGVAVVLAQDRDRFSREPAYTYLLRREFEEHGCKLQSLNDRGDGSPEGELTDGILDQLAKYERAKIAERSRRGKLRKAREGRAVAPIAKYGYRFNETRDALLVHDPEMAVVEKIFRMAAEGRGVTRIQSVLHNEGIPSPRGRPVWDRRVLRKIISSDDYRPLSYEEISELVASEVAARLDKSKAYGVQWYNRDKAVTRTVSEPDGSGGRCYRKRKTLARRPREEWLAIPVPASDRLPRELVDLARATMDANQGSERKRLAREWELRGVMRCSCGTKLKTKTMMPEGRGPYHYYICMRRFELRGMCTCTQKAIRAVDAEEAIWEFISRLLKDPERIRLGMERLIDEERETASRGDPHSTAKAWADKTAECARLRTAYQDQQAAGLMTLEELGSKLSELDAMRRHAERALSALQDHQERVEQLEEDRDALIKEMAETAPDALDSLAGEERNKVYRMLRLEVTPTVEGYSITGALRVRMQNGTDALEEIPGIGPETLEKIAPFATV
jgi:site-specific DNA recombinase